jgi:hypothetical protein
MSGQELGRQGRRGALIDTAEDVAMGVARTDNSGNLPWNNRRPI